MLEAVNTIANLSKEIQQLERLEWFSGSDILF